MIFLAKIKTRPTFEFVKVIPKVRRPFFPDTVWSPCWQATSLRPQPQRCKSDFLKSPTSMNLTNYLQITCAHNSLKIRTDKWPNFAKSDHVDCVGKMETDINRPTETDTFTCRRTTVREGGGLVWRRPPDGATAALVRATTISQWRSIWRDWQAWQQETHEQ